MSRKCNCPKPPGGGTECPSDSMAICRSENGECRGYCRQVPSGLSKLELDNWVLRIIKDDNRSLHQALSIQDRNILDNKQYIFTASYGTQIIISFDLPETDEISGLEQFSFVEA